MPTNAAARPAHASRVSLAALAVCAVTLEGLLLGGFLLPLSLWRQPNVITSPRVLALVMGLGPGGALAFSAAVIGAFVVYAAAVLAAHHVQSVAAVALVLGASALFAVTLLPTNPATADDVYHDVADARTLWLHGRNPALVPPTRFAGDPFLPNVPAWRDTPSAYGPLWYLLSGLPLPFTGATLWPNVIAEKALIALFLVAGAGLVMACAARIDRRRMVAAGVLAGWCPLLLWESAGAAHNDSVMLFFGLAALYAALRRWWLAVFPLLALAAAVKPTALLVAPVFLVWMLRSRGVPRDQLVKSIGLGAIVGATLFLPFFHGPSALAGLGRESGHVTSSPGGLVHTMLVMHFHVNGTHLLTAMKLVIWPVFLLVYAAILLGLPRDAAPEQLIAACFLTLFLFLVVASWWFMSWYVVWLVPFGALLPRRREAAVAVAFALAAMLLNVPHFWLQGQSAVTQEAAAVLTAFVLPVAVALAPGRHGPPPVRRVERLPRPAEVPTP